MKPFAGYRDPQLVKSLVASIRAKHPGRPVKFMHVCGTHENFIGQFGVRDLLPDWLRIIAGPGCPVCVCPVEDIDGVAQLALSHDVTVTAFGDIVRVPATVSLEEASARGADIRVVYSPIDAMRLAAADPSRQMVFFALGFETTAAPVAAAIKKAPENLSFFVSHRLIPPAMEALLNAPELGIDGFMLPGHVTTVMGFHEYEVFPTKYAQAIAVAGFEPVDILLGLDAMLDQIRTQQYRIHNAYRRSVRREGNERGQAIMWEVFEPAHANWRGIGVIPASGLQLRAEWKDRDATRRFPVAPVESSYDPGPCQCPQIMVGLMEPPDCRAFATACTPERPLGPCMVSFEGTCRAWHKYRRTALRD